MTTGMRCELFGATHSSGLWLSSLFQKLRAITIEKYFINQKIERVKELLVW
jgi:hypothetical protein